ncbi:MAG: chorismate-binding protein [Pseudomonadota bacterium]
MLSADNYQTIQFADTGVDLLHLYQFDPSFYGVLLETTSCKQNLEKRNAASHKNHSFDLLFFDAADILHQDNHQQLYLNNTKYQTEDNDFLKVFNQHWNEQNKLLKTGYLDSDYYPFCGGWFVFLSYEIANQVEPALKLQHYNSQLPLAYACRYKSALIYDHTKKELVLFSEDIDLIKTYINKINADLVHLKASNNYQVIKDSPIKSELNVDPQQDYLDGVDKIKHYIIEGDVFQVNLSRQWQKKISHADHNQLACLLYQRLRKNNPAPFSALVNLSSRAPHFANNSILSSSPERLLRVKNNYLESRPIAGTRPRGETAELDKKLIKQLHENAKEQSEHVMLIDLIRNDLGRVCVPGSIHIDEFMINETYQHVHHIVSNVVGKLASEMQPGDIIRALFPGGTITGCPKVRCMEIIAELEKTARGAYTGSLGYINNNGSMDLNILIRTMLIQQDKLLQQDKADYQSSDAQQLVTLRAGAGIVADSIAEKEILESQAKAKGMLTSLV